MGVEHWMIVQAERPNDQSNSEYQIEDPMLVRLRGLSSVVARGRAQIVI